MCTTQKLQPLSQEMVSYPLALLVISQSLLSVKYFEVRGPQIVRDGSRYLNCSRGVSLSVDIAQRLNGYFNSRFRKHGDSN